MVGGSDGQAVGRSDSRSDVLAVGRSDVLAVGFCLLVDQLPCFDVADRTSQVGIRMRTAQISRLNRRVL